MASMDNNSKYRNGSIDEQNRIEYERNDSVCPLTSDISRRGGSETKMEYQSDDHLDFRVSKFKATKYKKFAIISAGVAVMLAISTIILAVVLANKASSTTTSELCTKPECISAAARILSSMNRSVDPCQDFFTYSCGQWNTDHVIPEYKSSVSTFSDLRDSVALIVKRVLETDSSNDRDSIKKAKTYYSACLDTAKVDALGGKPAIEIVNELGGMPLFGDKLTSFSLEEALARAVSKYNSFSFVLMWIDADSKNSSMRIIKVDQPYLGMPNRDYYIQEARRNATLPAYKSFMHDYLEKIWNERGTSQYNETALQKVIEQIVQLETELAEAMMASADRRDTLAIYRKRTVEAMTNNITPRFNWEKYINLLFGDVDVTIKSAREIVSFGDHYFGNFTKILSKYDNGLLQNYIVWIALKEQIPYLSKSYRDTEESYRLATSGTSQEEARWRKCVDNVNDNFLMPVGSLFVQQAFSEGNKAITEKMVEHIREAFVDFLPSNDWMDETTKAEAKKKAEMVVPVIAYPDYIVDSNDPRLDEEYEPIKVLPEDYFKNNLNALLETFKDSMLRLDEPVDRTEWVTGPAIVNAFYSAQQNQIFFPAAILQPPFYDPGQPTSMNYGGIGMVIGHEITHGFDDYGSQYNGIGNLENWWTNASSKNFKEKSKCIEQQYGNYYWDEAQSKVNGKLTLGENIADNGGIQQAYKAYETWKDQNENDLNLPGLEEFSQDQLFFLSNAQIWCGLYRPEYAARLVATDSHSPAIFRVIGSLTNFKKFGEAYNCKKGQDRMYPKEEDVCRVW